jgi:hypothetical protein
MVHEIERARSPATSGKVTVDVENRALPYGR